MPMDEVQDRGWRWAVEEARRVVGDGPTYLSFDVDGLDPVYRARHRHARAGGLTHDRGAADAARADGAELRGGDVVEVSPPFDVGGLTAFHGARDAVRDPLPAGRGPNITMITVMAGLDPATHGATQSQVPRHFARPSAPS